jgi:aldose 1-epimerase
MASGAPITDKNEAMFPSNEANLIRLAAGPAEVVIDLAAGARLASWKIHGLELLEQRNPTNHPFGWGSYAMVPYAGRIDNGKFSFDGRDYELPITLETHAIHGTGYDNRWTVLKQTSSMAIVGMRMTEPWPFQGTITHLMQLSNDRFVQQIAIVANEDQPVTLGWHPWFRRDIGLGGTMELDADMSNAQQWETGPRMIPTGKLIPVKPRPWDDCFHDVGPVSMNWPGALRIDCRHDCPEMVIYDPPHAICVEPQSGPNNVFNVDIDGYRLNEGDIHEHTVEWRWHMASRQ